MYVFPEAEHPCDAAPRIVTDDEEVDVRRQILLVSFQPQATPPSGDPPAFDVKSGPGTVTLLSGDDQGVPTEISYETHVQMTGETTFVEDGTITVDGGGLRVTTVGTGVIEPSPEEGTLRGSVIWDLTGTGRLSGTTGLLTSNFEFTPEQGTAFEHQVLRLFLG
jgi:hypothetical protein